LVGNLCIHISRCSFVHIVRGLWRLKSIVAHTLLVPLEVAHLSASRADVSPLPRGRGGATCVRTARRKQLITFLQAHLTANCHPAKREKKTHCYKGDACLEPNTYQVLLAPHHPAGLSSGTVLIPSRSAKLLVAPQVRPQALSTYSLRIRQTALVWRAQHTSATNPMRQCALPAFLRNPTNCPPSHPTRKVPQCRRRSI